MEASSKSQPAIVNPTYQPLNYQVGSYQTFSAFYPYYLGEHHHPINRRLHLVGSSLSILIQLRAWAAAVPFVIGLYNSGSTALMLPYGYRMQTSGLRIRGGWKAIATLIGAGLIQGYTFSWVGHFFFEKNKPATFKHPVYSFRGDLTMLWEVLTLQRIP